jgi:DNA-binding MarR family transcriptional regulator
MSGRSASSSKKRLKRTTELLSPEGAVLIQLAADPPPTVERLAERLQVTNRTVGRYITALAERGLIERKRVGNRNGYVINRKASAGSLIPGMTVAEFLRRFDA